MKKFKWILLFSIVAVAATVYVTKYRFSNEVRISTQLRADLDKLHERKFENDPAVISTSLMRLASRQAPEGKQEAISRITHPNPTIRAGAARALVQFSLKDPEVKNSIEKLLADSDPSVRIALLENFQNRFEPERSKMLEEFVSHSGFAANLNLPGDDELLLAHFGLHQRAATDSERAKQLEYILSIAKQSDHPAFAKAIALLVRVARRDPSANEVLKKELMFAAKSKDKNLNPRSRNWPSILRYLANVEPDFVKPNFKIFADHPIDQVRASAYSTIIPLCPKDRWQVLTAAKIDPNDAQSNSWLTAVDRLGGKNASPLIRKKFNIDQPRAIRAKQIAMRHEKDEQDFCDRKSLRNSTKLDPLKLKGAAGRSFGKPF